jgi:signal transduction histidine kinase
VQPSPLIVDGARVRAERLLIRASGGLRVIQLAVGVPVLAVGGLDEFRSAGFISATYFFSLAWTALLYLVALRRDRFSLAWIVGDVALAITWLLAVPQMCAGACSVGWQMWITPPAMGSAILAVAFGPLWLALIGTLGIGAAYVGGVWPHLGQSQDAIGSAAVNAFFLLGFPLLAWFFAAWLRKSAQQLDDAANDAIEARAREAAAQARFDERTRQYDVLHHTVLTTLSKIARGGLDHRTEEVRELCARDADFLRGLVTGATDEGLGDFVAALAGVVRDKQALGLRVNSQFHALPASLPPRVAPMLLGAAREALTNVAKHAGTEEAWLTAVGEGAGVRVVVVDRGTGFDPSAVKVGRGLMRELRHSVIETGGTVNITSSPEHGTVVEVLWTP